MLQFSSLFLKKSAKHIETSNKLVCQTDRVIVGGVTKVLHLHAVFDGGDRHGITFAALLICSKGSNTLKLLVELESTAELGHGDGEDETILAMSAIFFL
jgi:hypothetical protein